jgi:outer membrane protein assembly factor BamB
MGGAPLFAVKAGAKGDITLKSGETSNDGVAWSRTRSGPYIVSPLLYQGYLYVAEQRGGRLSCYDAKTGKPAYTREPLQGARSFTSSPWAYHGKVFCLDEDGKTYVIQAGPELKVLGKNDLNEMFWSTPAIAGGSLFLRGVENLYCIRQQ